MMQAAAVILLLLSPAWAATPPEEVFKQATAALEAGDMDTAGVRFEEFRKDYPKHQLYWDAGIMWARCARDPATAEKRFAEVSEKAPPEVAAECEIEIAHLSLLQDRFDEAEKQYGEWIAGHAKDERAEPAVFYRAWCLKELGREGESATILEGLMKGGREPAWRGEAGLLLASLKFGSGDTAAARDIYHEMAGAEWARDFKPQALMGCARSAGSAGERVKLLRELAKTCPDTGEAEEARILLGGKKNGKIRFGVQVGAYSRRANAVSAKAQWDKKGKRANILPRKMGSLKLQAVVIGPFETREEAEREAGAVKAQGARAIVTSY